MKSVRATTQLVTLGMDAKKARIFYILQCIMYIKGKGSTQDELSLLTQFFFFWLYLSTNSI